MFELEFKCESPFSNDEYNMNITANIVIVFNMLNNMTCYSNVVNLAIRRFIFFLCLCWSMKIRVAGKKTDIKAFL